MTQLSIGDLDGLLRFLFSAIYERETDYTNVYMDITNPRIEDYLLFDYDLDLIFSSSPIRYVGTRSTGIKRMVNDEMVEVLQHVFKRRGADYGSMINIVPYEKESDVQDLTDPINVNCIMRKIGSEQVTNHRSTKFIMPIINIAVKGSDLQPYPKVFSRGIDPETYYCIQITEKYNDMMTLEEFINKFSPLEFSVIRSIIHQVVDIIYRMTEAYKNFRHHSFFPSAIQCYHYTNSGITYPELKLTDYFTASIDGSLHNKYQNPEITDYAIRNNYADLYQMMNYLWNTIRPDIEKHKELVEIFDVFLPRGIRSVNKSLSPTVWQSIDEETQHDMRVRNLRLNRVLAGREAMILGDFADREDDEQEGGSELEITDDGLTDQEDDVLTDREDDEEDDGEDDITGVLSGGEEGDEIESGDGEPDEIESDGELDALVNEIVGETEVLSGGEEADVVDNGELDDLVEKIVDEAPEEEAGLDDGRVDNDPEPDPLLAGGESDEEDDSDDESPDHKPETPKSSQGIVPMTKNSIYDDDDDDETLRRPVVVSSEGKPKVIGRVRGSRSLYKFKAAEIPREYQQMAMGSALSRPHADLYSTIINPPRHAEPNYSQAPSYNSLTSILGRPEENRPQGYPPMMPQQQMMPQQMMPQQQMAAQPQFSQEDYMRALAQAGGTQSGGRPFFFPQQ